MTTSLHPHNPSPHTTRTTQVSSNALVAYTFELGGKCVTADYGLLEDGISVHNSQNMWR